LYFYISSFGVFLLEPNISALNGLKMLQYFAALLIACLVLAGQSFGFQEDASLTRDWPEFRGPRGEGKAIGAELPTDFSDPSIVVWKTAIAGKGWSSPVIADGRIWITTAAENGKTMSAICVDIDSGKIVHDQVIHENENPAPCHPTNSYASPTPVIDSGKVYLHFGSYGTTCLNAKTGEQIWQRTDLPCDHFRGPASSPIVYKNLLIVAFDGADQQYVVALDKETGQTAWKRDREIDYPSDNGDHKKAYGTGAVFKIDGQPLLVYPSAIATIAYRPATGDPVWTVYHDGMNVSARPLLTKEGYVVINNGQGRMFAVDPSGQGDVTKSNIKWTMTKSVVKKSSPLVIEDRLFMVSDRGIASCVNTSDGNIVWQERLGGKFAASPIFDGENIFAFDEKGLVHVFQPDLTFQSVSKSKLGDGFRGSPAVSGNKLILRSLTHLYCLEKN
jgi:outer membrane protein assembly factor BamB